MGRCKSSNRNSGNGIFTSNEYLFANLENVSEEMPGNIFKAYGQISIGKLIESDYLNKVTNPIDNKIISKCAVVKITKNGSKMSAVFGETITYSKEYECDTNNSIIVSSLVAPEISINDGIFEYLYK